MSAHEIPEIGVQELARKLTANEDFVLLDVREAWELDHALIDDPHLKVAPMSRLAQLGVAALPEVVRDKRTEICVLCHAGVRSAEITAWLLGQGWTNVRSVGGGIEAYARLIDPSVGRY
jgi:rhodanese-related sulfurtransferase